MVAMQLHITLLASFAVGGLNAFHVFHSIPHSISTPSRLATAKEALLAKHCPIQQSSCCCSLSKMSLSSSGDDDMPDIDVDPEKILLLSLQMRVTEVFDSLNSSGKGLTQENLSLWQEKIDPLCKDLRKLTNKRLILDVYSSLLLKAAPQTLDPIRITTFELIANSVMDTLISLQPPKTAVTALIDDITDTNLNFIEKFKVIIDDGGEEGYSQSSRQEFLCYQFASLLTRVYGRLARGLGKDFDSSKNAIEMRMSNWASPVYARMQRRFVRFLASNVEEKTEEMNAEAFDSLCDKMYLEIEPKYSLSIPALTVSNEDEDDAAGTYTTPYAPWELTAFVLKVVRNTISCVGLESVESKVARTFRSNMTPGMKALGKKLEIIYQNEVYRLTGDERQVVEDMLNQGQQAVAACLTLWHIRYNVVGTPDLDNEGQYIKDFINPLSFKSPVAALEGMPKAYRNDAKFAVSEMLATKLKPSPALEAVAVVSYAMREFAGEEFRALITYDSNSDEVAMDRDGAFIVVFSEVLASVLTSPIFNEQWMREALLAMAILEETMATREPRASVTEAYERALIITTLRIRDTRQHAGEGALMPDTEDLRNRVKELERALMLMSRLSQTVGKTLRVSAFKKAIASIMSESDGEKSGAGLREVEKEYEWIACMLFIDPQEAKEQYVSPMGTSKFDKVVGDLLMNTDLTISLPQLGDVFDKQILQLASDVMMTNEEAEQRTGFLAGAVFETLVEAALKQYRGQMNTDRVDAMVLRAYSLYKHPLILAMRTRLEALEQKSEESITQGSTTVAIGIAGGTVSTGGVGLRSLKMEVGMKMVAARLGPTGMGRGSSTYVLELARMVDEVSQRSGGGKASVSAWGSGDGATGTGDVDYIAFLSSFQAFLLQEFAGAAASSSRGVL